MSVSWNWSFDEQCSGFSTFTIWFLSILIIENKTLYPICIKQFHPTRLSSHSPRKSLILLLSLWIYIFQIFHINEILHGLLWMGSFISYNVCLCIYVCVCVYIYIYIHTHTWNWVTYLGRLTNPKICSQQAGDPRANCVSFTPKACNFTELIG